MQLVSSFQTVPSTYVDEKVLFRLKSWYTFGTFKSNFSNIDFWFIKKSISEAKEELSRRLRSSPKQLLMFQNDLHRNFHFIARLPFKILFAGFFRLSREKSRLIISRVFLNESHREIFFSKDLNKKAHPEVFSV